MSGVRDIVIIAGIALLPLSSIQHFIWPLSWCLLADICNHTWIPECANDELMDSFRLFIDECDMFEYNCDHETDYEVTNYSLCFGRASICPKPRPCPSRPTCPDHRYHKMGDRYVYLNRRQGRRMNDVGGSTLPSNMLSGKRRYTPEKAKRNRTHYILRTRRTTPLRTRPRGPPTKHSWIKSTTEAKADKTDPEPQTVIVKRETVKRNGKTLLKIISRLANNAEKALNLKISKNNKLEDSDFLE